MTETASSTLNPSADIFIPGKNSILKDATNSDESRMQDISTFLAVSKTKDSENHPTDEMREIAKQLLIKYLVEKRNRGENAITKQEMYKIAKIVRLIKDLKVNPKMMPIEARLSKFPNLGKLKGVEKYNEAINYVVGKPFAFDLSVFKSPKPPTFLSSLYGLYRHEQAVRPLLSLTLPPSNLKDNLWSVTSKDLSLWNPSCDEPCTCPPMFGYSLPPSFFGNLFNLEYKCPKEKIHFCRYPPSANGNESMLLDTRLDYPVEVELLEDCIDDESKGESTNLEFYGEQLKLILSGVCDSISDETIMESKTSLTGDYEVNENYKDLLWDADLPEFVSSDEILEDDCHPLLEMDYTETNEEVPAEIKEMLRRCFSPDHKMTDNDNELEIDEGINMSCCDPPCSIWCHDSPKYARSDSISSLNSVSANIGLLTDTTYFLLNASQGSITSNGESGIESKFHNRIFKRSFSANDCDLSYEERCKINHEAPQFSSREDLDLSRLDPISFSKNLQKDDLWKDNDSGIFNQWSSREEMDIYSDMGPGSYDQDHAPMWSLFVGEDSLWKPLPECAQQDQHSRLMPKRVRDLRRQRSVN